VQIALRVGEQPLVRRVLESIPFAAVDTVARNIPQSAIKKSACAANIPATRRA